MSEIISPSDPQAILKSIVLRELNKLLVHSQSEFMLEEKHVKLLEALSRILKTAPETPAAEPTIDGVGDVGALLALVSPGV